MLRMIIMIWLFSVNECWCKWVQCKLSSQEKSSLIWTAKLEKKHNQVSQLIQGLFSILLVMCALIEIGNHWLLNSEVSNTVISINKNKGSLKKEIGHIIESNHIFKKIMMRCLPVSVLEHETVNSLRCHFSDTDGDVVFILLLFSGFGVMVLSPDNVPNITWTPLCPWTALRYCSLLSEVYCCTPLNHPSHRWLSKL